MFLFGKFLKTIGVHFDDVPRDDFVTFMMLNLPPGSLITAWVEED